MQQPQWEGVISCGGWVTDVLQHNPFIKNLIIVGASDELISQIPSHLRDKVLFYSQAEIDHNQAWPSKVGCSKSSKMFCMRFDSYIRNFHAPALPR